MLRRQLFAAALAVATLPALKLVGSVIAPKPGLLTMKWHKSDMSNWTYIEVSGAPSDVRAFAEAYQTNLWPDWRTHESNIARRMLARMDFDKGPALIAFNCQFTRDAWYKTMKDWQGPTAVV